MNKYFYIVITLFITGCATNSGVMPLGPDTYMITTAADMFRGGASSARQTALSEANEYCISLGKQLLVTSSQTSRFVGGGQSIDVTFSCLSQGDKDLTRPKYENSPDIVIENR